MRKELWAAMLGFLVGAAPIAGGDDEQDLREELRRLQREAARAGQQHWEAKGLPPGDDRGNQLAIFPVEDLSAPWFDQIPMSGEFLSEDSEEPLFGGQAEEGVQPFGTVEEIAEFVRTVVDPVAWEDGSMLNVHRQAIVALASPATNGRVRELLDRKLRPRAHEGVSVEFEVVELPAKMTRTLRIGSKPLTNAQRTSVDEAIRMGVGKRILALRGMGTMSSRGTVWHGKQVALITDADVEVAQTASTSDPVIQIAQAGGSLAVRAERGATAGEIKLELQLRMRELEAIRRHETDQAGVLDLPTMTDQDADLVLNAPTGAWVVAGAGSPQSGRNRLFLVRAASLARGGVR
jgi:hypothetical protein